MCRKTRRWIFRVFLCLGIIYLKIGWVFIFLNYITCLSFINTHAFTPNFGGRKRKSRQSYLNFVKGYPADTLKLSNIFIVYPGDCPYGRGTKTLCKRYYCNPNYTFKSYYRLFQPQWLQCHQVGCNRGNCTSGGHFVYGGFFSRKIFTSSKFVSIYYLTCQTVI